MGRRLIAILLSKGFEVHALVRETSVDKLPQRCTIAVVANAFAAESFSVAVPTGCTFVQLLGVAHPGPGKNEFKQIDLASARASAEAAKGWRCTFCLCKCCTGANEYYERLSAMSCAGRGGD